MPLAMCLGTVSRSRQFFRRSSGIERRTGWLERLKPGGVGANSRLNAHRPSCWVAETSGPKSRNRDEDFARRVSPAKCSATLRQSNDDAFPRRKAPPDRCRSSRALSEISSPRLRLELADHVVVGPGAHRFPEVEVDPLSKEEHLAVGHRGVHAPRVTAARRHHTWTVTADPATG